MSLLPGEQLTFSKFDEKEIARVTDDEINEKYVKGDVRIVTEQARYQLPQVAEMAESEKYELNPIFQRRPRWSSDKQSRLIESRLPVTERAGAKLWLVASQLQEESYPEIVKNIDAEFIRNAANRLEDTLIAESSGQVIYKVTEKRIDTEKLLNKPWMLLAPLVFVNLPSLCAMDFADACKSIAFELPTAGAFSLLRCTEGVLRHYYCSIVKSKRLPESKRMWGPMIAEMRNRRVPPPVELLYTLDRIRVNFRNPTQHPEKNYDIQEVQDLFGLCVDAINRMVQSPLWEMSNESVKYKFDMESKKDIETP